jgi:FAD:protein FMN transferase
VLSDWWTFGYDGVLGTSLDLALRAASEDVAAHAEAAALDELDRLEAIFSSFLPGSEWMRWQASRTWQTLSPELADVLDAADRWRRLSGDAFHPAAAALVGRPERCGEPLWERDPDRGWRCATDLPMTLNAIAKGEIVDRACAQARARGADAAVVNLGGDLRVCGCVRAVDVVDPRSGADNVSLARVRVGDAALATSGSYRRGPHLLDPRTGRPADRILSASALAPCARDADALATAASVLAPEESVALAESLLGAACLLVLPDRVVRSPRWTLYEQEANDEG